MLHHPNITPIIARMLTFFSQFDFTLQHTKDTSKVIVVASGRRHSNNRDAPQSSNSNS